MVVERAVHTWRSAWCHWWLMVIINQAIEFHSVDISPCPSRHSILHPISPLGSVVTKGCEKGFLRFLQIFVSKKKKKYKRRPRKLDKSRNLFVSCLYNIEKDITLLLYLSFTCSFPFFPLFIFYFIFFNLIHY